LIAQRLYFLSSDFFSFSLYSGVDMRQQNESAEHPRELRSRTQQPYLTYTLSEHYAVHRQDPTALVSKEAIASISERGRLIEVFPGKLNKRNHRSRRGQLGPVYAAQPGGTTAVPTGQIFIRFKDGVQVEDRRTQIEQAGYEITQRVEYAPQAAWLQSRSGEIADALAGIQALEKIADVENVEPQMLMQRSLR
jgi:hypothetical protein